MAPTDHRKDTFRDALQARRTERLREQSAVVVDKVNAFFTESQQRLFETYNFLSNNLLLILPPRHGLAQKPPVPNGRLESFLKGIKILGQGETDVILTRGVLNIQKARVNEGILKQAGIRVVEIVKRQRPRAQPLYALQIDPLSLAEFYMRMAESSLVERYANVHFTTEDKAALRQIHHSVLSLEGLTSTFLRERAEDIKAVAAMRDPGQGKAGPTRE